MIRSLNKFIFCNILGWEVTGNIPDDKKIDVVATINLDQEETS